MTLSINRRLSKLTWSQSSSPNILSRVLEIQPPVPLVSNSLAASKTRSALLTWPTFCSSQKFGSAQSSPSTMRADVKSNAVAEDANNEVSTQRVGTLAQATN